MGPSSGINCISIHALLAESDLWVLRKVPIISIFLSTLSLRRATAFRVFKSNCFSISIHALLAESDYDTSSLMQCQVISIHALLAESDSQLKPPIKPHRYFYPRSPCGERRQAQSLKIAALSISIHALLAESDPKYRQILLPHNAFLSTLSLRRATPQAIYPSSTPPISIHALLAESDAL